MSPLVTPGLVQGLVSSVDVCPWPNYHRWPLASRGVCEVAAMEDMCT